MVQKIYYGNYIKILTLDGVNSDRQSKNAQNSSCWFTLQMYAESKRIICRKYI